MTCMELQAQVVGLSQKVQTAEKLTYDTSITAPTTSNTIHSQQGRENGIARHTTHNGIPTTIFKAKDYYGIMADDCRFTLNSYRDRRNIDVVTKMVVGLQAGEDLSEAPAWAVLSGLPFHLHN
ncbi:hypothetical protein HAX54_043126 [Datura stramonium]|uniref:Uncharacterized protein n=1 Tax=Datura stramonium TaxID=4076 RepID=A0ABS8SN00_DATST|nr:hypothetical protein [Datura stramonium]